MKPETKKRKLLKQELLNQLQTDAAIDKNNLEKMGFKIYREAATAFDERWREPTYSEIYEWVKFWITYRGKPILQCLSFSELHLFAKIAKKYKRDYGLYRFPEKMDEMTANFRNYYANIDNFFNWKRK